MGEKKKRVKKSVETTEAIAEPSAPKAKQQCSACNGTVEITTTGQTLPFCRACQVEWDDSPERREAATARQRFVQRKRGVTP